MSEWLEWLRSLFETLTAWQWMIMLASFTGACLCGLYIVFRNLVPPKLPLRSVPVQDEKSRKLHEETAARRSVLCPKDLVDCFEKWPDVTTLPELLTKAAQTHGGRNCFGYRELKKIHKENKEVPTKVEGETRLVKKKWLLEERGPYIWYTYKGMPGNAVGVFRYSFPFVFFCFCFVRSTF